MAEWKALTWSGGLVHQLHAAPGERWAEVMGMLWARAFEWLGTVDAKYPWDTVTASVRPDSGRVLLSAHLAGATESVPGGPPDLVLPDLEQRYYDLPDSDNDETGFEEGHGRLVSECVSSLGEALRAEPAKSALARLRQKRPVRVVAVVHDDEETRVVLA